MHAHFQVFVYLEKFRNLDLFHQGEYAIRFECAYDLCVRNFKGKLTDLVQSESSFGKDTCCSEACCIQTSPSVFFSTGWNVRFSCSSFDDILRLPR
jgi:hypothetical protein